MPARFTPSIRFLAGLLLAGLIITPSIACPPLEKKDQAQAQTQTGAKFGVQAPREALASASPATRQVADPQPDSDSEAGPREERPTLAEVLDREDLESFRHAARRSNLQSALPDEGPITIFVPTDDAFDQLTEATKIALRSDRNTENLRTILAHHVTLGHRPAESLIGASSLDMLSGQSVEIDASYGGIQIGRAGVIETDLTGGRAIVHVIDRVLIPKDLTLVPDGPLLLGVYVRRPASELAEELDMRRSGLLLVSSVINGSNAESSGVLAGDIIYRIDDRPASVEAGEQAKAEKGIGNKVELLIIRDGERLSIDVPVGVEPR